MRKHHFRESIKSFFGGHVAPEKDEELRRTRQEIEVKVKRIWNLVKGDHEEEDGVSVENSRKESLAELIDDFYEHYQALYARYDHLTGELRKKVHDKQDGESSSSSDSDSDNSSKHKDGENEKMEGEFQKMMDELKQELDALKSEVTDLKRELVVTREEKEALDREYQTSLRRIKEADEASRNLMLKADRLNVEKLELLVDKEKMTQDLETACKIEAEQSQRLENIDHERHNLLMERENAMRRIEEREKITEDLKIIVDRLEAEKATLWQELETLKIEIFDKKEQLVLAEQQISNLSQNLRATEEENETLSLKVSEISKEIEQGQSSIQELFVESGVLKDKLGVREREILTLKEMHEMHGNASSARIKELEGEIQRAHISAQELLADSSQFKDKLGERELELLTLKEMHEMHGNESSTRIKEMEAHVASQELEVELLRARIKDVELQIENKATEGQQLREENTRLQSQIEDFEKMAKHREDEISAFIKRLDDKENESVSKTENLTAQINNLLAEVDTLCACRAELEARMLRESEEASTQVKRLVDQVNILQQELDLLQKQKTEMESLIERERQEYLDSLTQLENQNSELMSHVADKQRMLEEHVEVNKNLGQEYKQLDGWFQECKINLEVAEKRIEEMAEEFRMKIEPKNQKVAELEAMIEALKRDIEVKSDELITLVDHVSILDVELHLSNQVLQVAEQLLIEKEENFRNSKAKFLEEQRMLEERITILSGSLAANSEAYGSLMTDISGKVKSTLAEVDIVIHKFEDDFENYRSCIEEVCKELQMAKHWVRETNNERDQLKTEITSLRMELKDKKEQESLLRERVGELEMKARKEKGEKEVLTKTVHQLEKDVEVFDKITKEKDEGMMRLGEEKREAIRQLCFCIDYHLSQNYYLREVLSKMPVRRQSTT